MKLRAKKLPINTGGIQVVVIDYRDAALMDLFHGDRVKLTLRGKKTIAVVDIDDSDRFIKKGTIGLFEEVSKALGVKSRDKVRVALEIRPPAWHYIKQKLSGERLSHKQIRSIIEHIVDNGLTDIEVSYFVAACYTNGLNLDETTALAKAMINTGDTIKLDKKFVMDKHCVGGVAGNRTTMMIVPIIAAAGLTIPKTSSRAITSPAGTADTVETLTNVSFNIKQIKRIVKKTNGCMVWGGAVNLAPADDKIIGVERPMSVDPTGQLLASILSKKKSVSATHVLIDIPVGKGSKIESKKEALKLKSLFERLAKKLRMHVKVILTSGLQPVGHGVGPILEAKDVVCTLMDSPKGSKDLKEKSLVMAGYLLEMGGKAKKGKGYELAKEILESGRAYNKFVEIIRVQGGKKPDPVKLRPGRFKAQVKTKKAGKVTWISSNVISRVARTAGAPFDKAAGVYLYKKIGDKVKKGEYLFTIYAHSKEKLRYALRVAKKAESYKIT